MRPAGAAGGLHSAPGKEEASRSGHRNHESGQAQRARAATRTGARPTVKIALFLGAGASSPYGMPTTKELKEKIKHGDLDFPRKDLLDPDEFPDIEHVLSVLDQLIRFAESRAGKLYAPSNDDTSETPEFPHSPYDIAMYNYVDHFNQHVEQSRKSKEIVEQLICRCYNWYLSHSETAEKILGPLFDLAKSEEGHITVFTTNYDTVIEEYCGDEDRQTERVDGFRLHEAMYTRVWDGEFVPRNQNYRTKVFLYKLHGSMNWLADNAAGKESIVQKPNTDMSGDRARDMYIRPSLDTKDEATQKEPYATILRQFAQTLPSFDTCVVIGYSFRDPHISKALVEFAKSGKVLVVVSPTAAVDFKNNALQDSGSDKKIRWTSSGRLRRMDLESNGRKGTVYAFNNVIDMNNIRDTIGAIRSVIKGGVSSPETSASGLEG